MKNKKAWIKYLQENVGIIDIAIMKDGSIVNSEDIKNPFLAEKNQSVKKNEI